MANQIAQYRNITLTQGGADAFVQAIEYTNIDPSIGNCWLIRRVEMSFNLTCLLENLSADAAIQWSLARESLTAVGGLDNADVLHNNGFAIALTTSGQPFIPKTFVWEPPSGLMVVTPALYAQLDSTATGLTLVASMRVYYETIKLSELDILRMLSQG